MLDLSAAVCEMAPYSSRLDIATRVALECVLQHVKLDRSQFKLACGRLCGDLMLKDCRPSIAVEEARLAA